MNAIEIKNLTKVFGEKHALTGLNMTVPMGSIYGFIGENGSGKSTTEKIICGLIHPTSGEVRLFGKDYTDLDVRANVGVLIEAPGCFPGLTVRNNLIHQATNLGIKNKKDEVRNVLKMVRMEGAASNKYKNCSLGMKQRIGIAMALLGKPKLLVLLVGIFVAIYLLASVVAKQRLWLSLILSFGIGMLFFTMIPIITPLNSTIVNLILCLVGSGIFATGIGIGSYFILKKTSLV